MEGKCVVFLQQNLWRAVTGSKRIAQTKMFEGTLNKLRLVSNALHEGLIQRFFQGLAMPRFAGGVV
jgi:hypothetical protein